MRRRRTRKPDPEPAAPAPGSEATTDGRSGNKSANRTDRTDRTGDRSGNRTGNRTGNGTGNRTDDGETGQTGDRPPESQTARLRRRAAFLRDLAEAKELRARVSPRRTRVARLRQVLRRSTYRNS